MLILDMLEIVFGTLFKILFKVDLIKNLCKSVFFCANPNTMVYQPGKKAIIFFGLLFSISIAFLVSSANTAQLWGSSLLYFVILFPLYWLMISYLHKRNKREEYANKTLVMLLGSLPILIILPFILGFLFLFLFSSIPSFMQVICGILIWMQSVQIYLLKCGLKVSIFKTVLYLIILNTITFFIFVSLMLLSNILFLPGHHILTY